MFRRRKKNVCTSICWIIELSCDDALVNPLVAGIEAARVPDHRDEPRLALAPCDRLGGGKVVGERYLDLDMLAGVEAGDRLARMELRRRRENHRVEVGPRECFREFGRDVGIPNLRATSCVASRLRPDQRNHLDVIDLRQRFDVLDAECAGAGETNLHRSGPRMGQRGFSKMMWPTAVFDAGT